MPFAEPVTAPMDARVRRTRSAVAVATVDLLTALPPEADVTVTDIATTAGVSRRAIYQNFRTLEGVLLESALWLLRQAFPARSEQGRTIVDLALHFEEHRPFYARVLTGSSAHAVHTAIVDTFQHDVRRVLRQAGRHDDPALARFLMHGMLATLGEALPDPEDSLLVRCREMTALAKSVMVGPTSAPLPRTDW